MILIYIFIFILGTIIGSFLNVVIFRLKVDEKGTRINLLGRSKCPKCKAEIRPIDLIPIVSFFLLGGKCRNCGIKISWQYPIVEFISSILPVLVFWQFGFRDAYSFFLVLSTFFLIIIFFYDLHHQIIPDAILLPLAVIWIIFDVYGIIKGDVAPLNLIAGIAIGSLVFAALSLFSKERLMGFGDAKLGAVLGMALLFPKIIFCIFAAFILGSLISLVLIAAGNKTMKSQIAFGPFLIIGYFIAVFCGDRIINWYLNFI